MDLALTRGRRVAMLVDWEYRNRVNQLGSALNSKRRTNKGMLRETNTMAIDTVADSSRAYATGSADILD